MASTRSFQGPFPLPESTTITVHTVNKSREAGLENIVSMALNVTSHIQYMEH